MLATKEQERKALEQIRKIVDELGEGSYVGTAFEGCFEIAEDNIGNDFACSMKQRVESARKEAESWKNKNELLKNTISEMQKQTDSLKMQNEESQKVILELKKQLDDCKSQNNQDGEKTLKLWNKFRETEERADAAEQEIVRLKAKLYDFMCQE